MSDAKYSATVVGVVLLFLILVAGLCFMAWIVSNKEKE